MQQRYYDPAVGRFLSVDPMVSDTNTGWNFNRYNYAANNPYKFKDPDGRVVVIAPGVDPEFEGKASAQFNALLNSDNDVIRGRAEQLVNSPHLHVISPLSAGKRDQAYNQAASESGETDGIGTGTATFYDPDHSYRSGGVEVAPTETLAHELLGHGGDKDGGKLPSRTERDPKTGNTRSEQSAIDVGNEYRRSVGEKDKVEKH